MRLQRLATGAAILALAAGSAASAQTASVQTAVSQTANAPEMAASAATAQPFDMQAFAPRGAALGAALAAPGEVERFYSARNGQLAWSRDGRIGGEARQLIDALEGAEAHGLNPQAYHLAILTDAANARGRLSPDEERQFDALMTDAFMALAGDLLNGRVDPSSFESLVETTPEARDLVFELEAALRAGRVEAALDDMAPQHDQYAALKDAYQRYLETAQTEIWPTIDDGETLEAGERSPRVAQIRARLDAEDAFEADGEKETKFLAGLFGAHRTVTQSSGVADDGAEAPADGDAEDAQAADPMLYDEALAARIEAFQARRGLAVDGKVGPNTLAMLNQSVQDRADAIALNMERWRWLPNRMEGRYVLVNTPEYRVRGYDDDRVTLTMDVIVGAAHTETPQFSDQIEYVAPNPTWTVPYSIATTEMIHDLRADPDYAARKNLAIYRDGQRVDPSRVNWDAYSRADFPFTIVQQPGADNALGRIKFMFPNRHHIYLHDTNTPRLFSENMRALSHGCIRLSDPFEFGRWLADGDGSLSNDVIQDVLARGTTEELMLETPVPVHIAYFTAWAGDDDAVQFYGDVYERDERLRSELLTTS